MTATELLDGKPLSARVEQVTGKKVSKIRIMDNAVLVRVSFGRVGVTRKVSPDEICVETEGNVKISKRLLDSPEMRALTRYDAQINQYIRRRTNKPKTRVREGLCFLGVKLIDEFDAKMRNFAEGRRGLVQNLKLAYAEIINSDRQRLYVTNNGVRQSVFRESDYLPVDQLEEAFSFEVDYLELVAPRSMAAVREDLYQKAEERIMKQAEEDADAIRTALRVELADLMEWSIDRLSPDANGKKKVFKSKGKNGEEIGFTARLNDFLNVFDGRNLTGDTKLTEIVERARAIMTGVDGQAIRDSEPLRESLRTKFTEIKDTIDPLIEEGPIRRIDI